MNWNVLAHFLCQNCSKLNPPKNIDSPTLQLPIHPPPERWPYDCQDCHWTAIVAFICISSEFSRSLKRQTLYFVFIQPSTLGVSLFSLPSMVVIILFYLLCCLTSNYFYLSWVMVRPSETLKFLEVLHTPYTTCNYWFCDNEEYA